MIAFGHSIFAPFLEELPEIDNSDLPILKSVQVSEKFNCLTNTRIFDQNQGRDVLLSSNLSFDKNMPRQEWIFEVNEVVSFYWICGSDTIKFHEDKDGNPILTKYWFLHTLLPIYLTIENKFELIHAGSVEIDAQPVLFIGPSYGGKSTLTDYFIKQNHVMISDDRVALNEKNSDVLATSSYAYHRPYRKMEDLGLKVPKFMTHTKKLHMIYVLEQADPTDKVTFTKLKGIETFKALQYNFDFILPLNKARSFELIAKIASMIPIYRICIPWDIDRLDEVYEKICAHSNNKENV